MPGNNGAMQITFTLEPAPSMAVVETTLHISALKAVKQAVFGELLPLVRTKAPGSIGEQITAGEIREVENGLFEVDIYMPTKYLSVELGSGVYGPTGAAFVIVPKERNDGKHHALFIDQQFFAMSAVVNGQEGQHFLQESIDEILPSLLDWGIRELFSDIA